jgi:hypothetical protein
MLGLTCEFWITTKNLLTWYSEYASSGQKRSTSTGIFTLTSLLHAMRFSYSRNQVSEQKYPFLCYIDIQSMCWMNWFPPTFVSSPTKGDATYFCYRINPIIYQTSYKIHSYDPNGIISTNTEPLSTIKIMWYSNAESKKKKNSFTCNYKLMTHSMLSYLETSKIWQNTLRFYSEHTTSIDL